MLFDREVLVSNAQSVTTGTVVSTDVIDLWNATALRRDNLGNNIPYDIGRIQQAAVGWRWFVQVVTTFASMTSVDARLVQSANADLSSPSTVVASGAIAVATLVAGYRFRVFDSIPWATVTSRYIGMNYVVVGTGTGNITAGITTQAVQSAGLTNAQV